MLEDALGIVLPTDTLQPRFSLPAARRAVAEDVLPCVCVVEIDITRLHPSVLGSSVDVGHQLHRGGLDRRCAREIFPGPCQLGDYDRMLVARKRPDGLLQERRFGNHSGSDRLEGHGPADAGHVLDRVTGGLPNVVGFMKEWEVVVVGGGYHNFTIDGVSKYKPVAELSRIAPGHTAFLAAEHAIGTNTRKNIRETVFIERILILRKLLEAQFAQRIHIDGIELNEWLHRSRLALRLGVYDTIDKARPSLGAHAETLDQRSGWIVSGAACKVVECLQLLLLGLDGVDEGTALQPALGEGAERESRDDAKVIGNAA